MTANEANAWQRYGCFERRCSGGWLLPKKRVNVCVRLLPVRFGCSFVRGEDRYCFDAFDRIVFRARARNHEVAGRDSPGAGVIDAVVLAVLELTTDVDLPSISSSR